MMEFTLAFEISKDGNLSCLQFYEFRDEDGTDPKKAGTCLYSLRQNGLIISSAITLI
jgi:hypothetical protein